MKIFELSRYVSYTDTLRGGFTYYARSKGRAQGGKPNMRAQGSHLLRLWAMHNPGQNRSHPLHPSLCAPKNGNGGHVSGTI
jgi:hypothetical protein